MERKHKVLIAQLAENSFTEKNEPCLDTVSCVIKILRDHWQRSFKELLDYYYHCLCKSYERRCLHVEYSGSLEGVSIESIFPELNYKLLYQENPQLIGGLKIRHEDWVWDQTIRGQLYKLMQTFKNVWQQFFQR